MADPDGLERLLKSLEGHFVDSVELSREEGLLHVEMSVIELDPNALQATLGDPKDLSFTVMWKKTLDEVLEHFNKKMDEILSNLGKQSLELGGIIEETRKGT